MHFGQKSQSDVNFSFTQLSFGVGEYKSAFVQLSLCAQTKHQKLFPNLKMD